MITWDQLLTGGIVALVLGALLIFLGYFLDSRTRSPRQTAPPRRQG